ncbi:maleylpyruvate isomerase family mycothiol-dependent enzyme [Herbiconiux daphne]|uniref:Maleylpyruvate isomerase family mycothiol-dependent enzyme n=1 Tax=Herbiconiux daphne TaxID=2970914 RepID=A0ABT2H3P7_9MICO|nr:maleylpyruvate isomerase family mycothiol-dependent enzyme [Herbiconiux daphne]MCS5734558.1 maleylpyruvate isomerase family mycothiol-dependent enzyme [Herbiconiux daphne]
MGARTDRTSDPALQRALLLARHGQAYFARTVHRLSDEEFDAPSLLPGWNRRHVIAHVGLNARALTRLIEWADTGVETPMYSSPGQRAEEIDLAATLAPQALRNLCDHAAIHLSVEWRDLPDERWSNLVRTAQGRTVPASETVWMRTREVWMHAVDLASGAAFADFPPELVDALLADVRASWARRAATEELPEFVFEPTDRLSTTAEPHPGVVVVSGPAAALASWATGRGGAGVERAGGGTLPAPPRWL